MCEFVVNSFPFEIIMMGTAARRAGEPFVQQFLDKHSRSCWRPTPRCALFLRRVTPTRSHFSRPDVAFVCAALPATPYSSVRPRQRDRKFPGRTSPLLASHSPLRLVSPSDHANTTGNFPGERRLCLRRPPPLRLIPPLGHANATGNFPGGHRLCWRPPPRCALSLRLATPTPSGNFLTC